MKNNLDKQYTDLLQDILDNGIYKGDRTGTGTISVFGRQIRHKMSDGFPLLTTKKMPWKVIVTELIWFLRGDTNIKFLVDNGCNIWNGDAFKVYKLKCEKERDDLLAGGAKIQYMEPTMEMFIDSIKNGNQFTGESAEEFSKKHGDLGPIYGAQWRNWGAYKVKSSKGILVKKEDGWYVKWSDLHSFGRGTDWVETILQESNQSNIDLVEGDTVYFGFGVTNLTNKQFKPYNEAILIPNAFRYNGGVDQISNLIKDLTENPDSRRLMVNAWNVGELDKMTLPPCHYGFQVYTRNLTNKELEDYLIENYQELYQDMGHTLMNDITISLFEVVEEYNKEMSQIKELQPNSKIIIIPTRAISLMWNQRSVDTFLGLPFNIASYGLLLEIIAKAVNMIPDELIGNLGDTHLYLNHIEQAKEQLGRDYSMSEIVDILKADYGNLAFEYRDVILGKMNAIKNQHYEEAARLRDLQRELEDTIKLTKLGNGKTRQPFPLPTLKIEDTPMASKEDYLPYYHPTDFELIDYQSHPAIKAPLSN